MSVAPDGSDVRVERVVTAVDCGMALNPHMRAFITHGRFDMVTPYYTSDRLVNLMRLDPATAGRLTVQHYGGGHMFYAWEESRHAFTTAIAEFYASALAG